MTIRAGTQEIGCGTYTVMSQIAADALGIPVERVTMELGDTDMPENPASTGSVTASSTGAAVHDAAVALRQKLEGMMQSGESFTDAIRRAGGQPVEVTVNSRAGPDAQQYSMHSFGAVFTEVRVDESLGIVRIPRIVTAHGVGKILNEKTARSQIIGGVVWGIGMALTEETLIDPRTGRYVNADLAEYHLPVNADVGTIDVNFVEENDPHINPIGAKGVGEIGITGVGRVDRERCVSRDRQANQRSADSRGSCHGWRASRRVVADRGPLKFSVLTRRRGALRFRSSAGDAHVPSSGGEARQIQTCQCP